MLTSSSGLFLLASSTPSSMETCSYSVLCKDVKKGWLGFFLTRKCPVYGGVLSGR